jgi:hypothetical protein
LSACAATSGTSRSSTGAAGRGRVRRAASSARSVASAVAGWCGREPPRARGSTTCSKRAASPRSAADRGSRADGRRGAPDRAAHAPATVRRLPGARARLAAGGPEGLGHDPARPLLGAGGIGRAAPAGDDRGPSHPDRESGSGKTRLATALAVCACQQGRRVASRRSPRSPTSYARVDPLRLDQVGYLALREVRPSSSSR